MYCNYCGGQIQPDQRFCATCGRPATPAAAGAAAASPGTAAGASGAAGGRVGRHVRMLAVFWIALSVWNLLRAGGRLIGARVLRSVGREWLGDMNWGFPAGHVISLVLWMLGMLTLLLAVGGFLVGFGLMERRPWARSVAIGVAILALLNPILGTILGIYTLWVLLPADAEREYGTLARV